MTDQVDGTLLDELKREIAANGPMPVSAYMARCLYDPKHGYYRRRNAIGADGDFVTAPEINQIFGELLGIWVTAVWQQMGSPDRLRLVELGPGRGTMMRDMLRAMRAVPSLLDRVSITLVDVSEQFREVQRATLADVNVPINWAADLGELVADQDAAAMIVVANEFFDALPVSQYVRHGDGWAERAVAIDPSGALAFKEISDSTFSFPERLHTVEGDVVESRRTAYGDGAPPLMSTLSALEQKGPLALLAIDYGYEGPAIGDTLQAMRAQQYADVLAAPGHQDLTAHVDFAELADVLRECGLACDGPISQAAFLEGMAFSARLETLLAGKDARQANAIETAAHRLVAEPGMGVHFRVLAARSLNLPVLVPFPA